MPHAHDLAIRQTGTRVRLFAQSHYLEAFQEPETVWLAPSAGSVGPGPSDDRIYVVDPIGKEQPYEFPYLPPYRGPAHPPVAPDADVEGNSKKTLVQSRQRPVEKALRSRLDRCVGSTEAHPVSLRVNIS